MKNLFKFEPVATLAGLQLLVQAVLALITFTQGWDTALYGLVQGIQAATFAFLATFVRGSVVPTASLEALQPLTPEEVQELAAQNQ